MSRSDEFNAGTGSRWHPNVDHYRDGGIGGVGPERSVVGLVPTHVVAKMAEWDRTGRGANPDSPQVIDGLRQDLRAGKGFTSPLMVEYNHKEGWAYLGEGNHRLAAAQAEGVPEVPVRVVRSLSGPANRKQQGIGVAATHQPIPGAPSDYFPSDVHPSYLRFGERHDAGSLGEEIHSLLTPDPWNPR